MRPLVMRAGNSGIGVDKHARKSAIKLTSEDDGLAPRCTRAQIWF